MAYSLHVEFSYVYFLQLNFIQVKFYRERNGWFLSRALLRAVVRKIAFAKGREMIIWDPARPKPSFRAVSSSYFAHLEINDLRLMTYVLQDTHAHLDFPAFDKDREEVIERARKAGIEKIVCVGCDSASSDRCIELAHKYDFIDASIGVHPSDADKWNTDLANKFIVQAKGDKKVVSIGEIGLDYFHLTHPKELQKRVFREQLELAKQVGLPVCVHMRESASDVYDVLIDSGIERVTLHCFNEGLEFAEKAWARGWVLGFGGTITYPKNEALRKVVAVCPSELFVLETDCPFLPPQGHRGERNEPAYVVEVERVVREVRS